MNLTIDRDGNRLYLTEESGGYAVRLYSFTGTLIGMAYGHTTADTIVNLGISLGGRTP